MQYFEKTLTTKVNLDIPINGINQDCLKFIPKTKHKKKQKIVIGDVQGFIYLIKNSKQQWCSNVWQKVDEKLSQEEKSIKSLQICKILKSKKNKRDRILFSDGKYIKCVNKGNLLQSDNQNLDQQYGKLNKVFGNDDHLIIHTQQNNTLSKIKFKKSSSWLSLAFDLKLQILQQKPYLNEIRDLDYDYETQNLVFSSLNCVFITDKDLNAVTGIGHSSDLGRVKVFDIRKQRFNAFSIQPQNFNQQQSQGNQNQPAALIPIQSVLVESKNAQELILGTYFKNQYAQIDQILSTAEQLTCFGYGDIFKSEKNQIVCAYKGGFQIFQEDLNRNYESIESVAQNILLPNIPISCESGDFKDDLIHQNLGEFILYSQDGLITSISPKPDQNQNPNLQGNSQKQGFRLKQEMQNSNPLNQNNSNFGEQSSQINNQNQQRQISSISLQPNLMSKQESENKQNESLYLKQNSSSKQDSNTQNKFNTNNVQKTVSMQNQIPPQPKQKHKLEFRVNKNSSQFLSKLEQKEDIDEQKDKKDEFEKKKRNFQQQIYDDDQEQQTQDNQLKQEENHKKQEKDSYQYFMSQLQRKKSSKIVDEETDEIEKQFQAALNKSSQPFIISKASSNNSENKNSKLSSVVFSSNANNKTLGFKQNSIINSINNEQRQELVEKLIKNTQNNKYFDAEDILKITEKSPKKQEKKSNQDYTPTKYECIIQDFNQVQEFQQQQQQLSSQQQQSPIKLDSYRGRLRRPSLNKQRENSINFQDLACNFITDFQNQSSCNYLDQEFSLKQDSQSEVESNGYIQSPDKFKVFQGQQKSSQKSNIVQNLEKELQKNQINFNFSNPLEFLKKSSNESSSAFNQQRQQKIKDEQEQRGQQQMVYRRRRISSDFYNLSQEQIDQVNNQSTQLSNQQNDQKDQLFQKEIEQSQQDKLYQNNSRASPMRYSRQSSIDKFYNQEKQEERPNLLINNNRNNNDLSIYIKLEEVQNGELASTLQKFSLNKDYSKEDLISNAGLSFQQSSDNLSYKQNPTIQNNIPKFQQPNNLLLKSQNKKKDSFDYFEDTNNQQNILNQIKNIEKNQNQFNLNDENFQMNKKEASFESSQCNQKYDINTTNNDNNNFSNLQTSQRNNQKMQQYNKSKSSKLFLQGEDEFDFCDEIIEEKQTGQIQNSKAAAQLNNSNHFAKQHQQYSGQIRNQIPKDNRRVSVKQSSDLNEEITNLNEKIKKNQYFKSNRSSNQSQRNSNQNFNIKKEAQTINQQTEVKIYVLDSPTKAEDQDQSNQNYQQKNLLWRQSIPSRSFLNIYQKDEHNKTYLLPQNNSKAFYYDSDEIHQLEQLPIGYVCEQGRHIQQNNYKNSSFKIIKQYNSQLIEFFKHQDIFRIEDKNNILQLNADQKQFKYNHLSNSFDQKHERDSIEQTIENLRKEIQDIQYELKEICQFFNEQVTEKVMLLPSVNYKKQVLYKQNRVRYNIQTQYQIQSIFVQIKTPRSVEITQSLNLDVCQEENKEIFITTEQFPQIQINKCQGANEEFKLQSYEIKIIDKDAKSIYFDMQYNEDGFTVETSFQIKFNSFEDSCYELVDKNKAFQFLQLENVSAQNLMDSTSSYHSLKLECLQKKQFASVFQGLFNFQINEYIQKYEEFFVKTVNHIFDFNIILHCLENHYIFYSQSLQYIKCLQNRISSRIDESVYKIQFSINTSQKAYQYHFDRIFSKIKFRKDIREQQSILMPLQEIIQTQGYEGISKQYKRLLLKQDELNQNFQKSYDFDEICRLQLDSIVRCYCQINPQQKSTFEKQKNVIDNLIFNLRVKQIFTLLFPLEKSSFVGN
ncbi:hypothetical protein ABPG72_001163 [Tetrahymena utriculariae]